MILTFRPMETGFQVKYYKEKKTGLRKVKSYKKSKSALHMHATISGYLCTLPVYTGYGQPRLNLSNKIVAITNSIMSVFINSLIV